MSENELHCMYSQSSTRGLTAFEEAEYWINFGVDKPGLMSKFISQEIGKNLLPHLHYLSVC